MTMNDSSTRYDQLSGSIQIDHTCYCTSDGRGSTAFCCPLWTCNFAGTSRYGWRLCYSTNTMSNSEVRTKDRLEMPRDRGHDFEDFTSEKASHLSDAFYICYCISRARF